MSIQNKGAISTDVYPHPQLAGKSSQRNHLRTNFRSGPRCPMCHSYDVRPFASIYGHGTTNYLSSQGLVFHTKFRRTRRQTVLAQNCAPPKKLPWWPTIFLLTLVGASILIERILPRLSDLTATVRYWLLWASLVLTVATAAQNYVFQPVRMEAWGRKLLCQRCGVAFDAQE